MRFGPTFLRPARDEPDAELRIVAGQERTTGAIHDLSAKHPGPELRQTSRVVRVEVHRQQSRKHHRTVDAGLPTGNTKPNRREGGTGTRINARRTVLVEGRIREERPRLLLTFAATHARGA